MLVELLVVVVSVCAAIAIALYATWLLAYRLRTGDAKPKAFGEWLSNILQAILGL